MRTWSSLFLFTGVLLAAALMPPSAAAQELNCRVTVAYPNLTGTNYTFLDELDDRIAEYLNDRTWTRDAFEEREQIECTVQITLEQAPTLTSFAGRIVVASRRPIYGTGVSSTVVQLTDADLQFSYTQGTPLIFDLERYDPLASVLDFYAFLILGYDYDTFSDQGGTPYFELARRIADRAQSSGAQGWSSMSGDQSRYALISQILDPRYKPLRTAYFAYHYGGLDHFISANDAARAEVLAVLENIQELYSAVNRSHAIDVFFSAKYSELTSVFRNSPLENQAFALLSRLDPSHLTDYNQLLQ